jgi:hypothetical protein
LRANALVHATVVLAGFVITASAGDVAKQIQAEIQRVRDLASSGTPDPRFKDLPSHVETTLRYATEDVAAGNTYSALEKLSQASDLVGGMRVASNDAAVVKGGMPAFEIEWKNASRRVSAIKPVPPGTPAAIRALAETAHVQAIALLDGGRGFATSMQPKDGLFYLGEAQGLVQFASFCADLDQGRAAKPLTVRSLAPELRVLQDKTDAAFVPPQSIEKHPAFIGLNSAIKLATELDDAKFYAGALYRYLDAVRQYGMLNAGPVSASAQERLRTTIAAERRKIAGSRRDDSIREAWLERADSAIAHTPNDDVWKAAAVLVGQVLPAYDAALGAPSAVEARPTKAVEVTLVRWPYT